MPFVADVLRDLQGLWPSIAVRVALQFQVCLRLQDSLPELHPAAEGDGR